MAVLRGEETTEKAAPAARRTRGHPMLRGWKRDRYTHGMHPAQMEALRAMCGALIPPLPAEVEGHGRGDPPGGKDLERFYNDSAADSIIPDEVTHPSICLCSLPVSTYLISTSLLVNLVFGQINHPARLWCSVKLVEHSHLFCKTMIDKYRIHLALR